MDVRFVFKSTSGKPKVHSKRLPVLIGRSDASEIKLRISKDSVSRRHCEFFRDEEGRVCIRDLESTNGTFVDGRQLKPRVATPVSSGASIKLGNVGFRVEYQVGPVARSPHDSDTIPIDAAELTNDVEDLEPIGPEPTTQHGAHADATSEPEALEPLESVPSAAVEVGDEGDAEVDTEAPADGDFGFLAAAEEAPAEAAGGWPEGDDAPAGGGDANLDDFLKGLP